jgi:CspA family cold shock protein
VPGLFFYKEEESMHSGKIKKLVSDRGFGFIADTDGREVFFHQSALIDVKFEALTEDQKVEFDVENSPKGPRAINIKVIPA